MKKITLAIDEVLASVAAAAQIHFTDDFGSFSVTGITNSDGSRSVVIQNGMGSESCEVNFT